jgi:hypothetical protein
MGCKIPNGLICTLFEKRTQSEATLGGTRSVEQYFPTDKAFTLNGPGHPHNAGPGCQIANGFALTFGVPKDLADEWMRQNETLPAVRNGLIFCAKNRADSIDKSMSRKAQKSGLERVNTAEIPVLDPRLKGLGLEVKIDKERSAKPVDDEYED